MGHDDPRLRWRWLHGVSPEGEADIAGDLTASSDAMAPQAVKRNGGSS